MRLENKVAIITGASSGIGWSTAKLFAQEGAKLVITARRENLLEKLAAEILDAGGHVTYLAGDIQSEEHNKELVAKALSDFGRLDIGFHNAGIIGAQKSVLDISLSEWHDTVNTNLTSGFLCAKHQIPALLESGEGSLIFTSSFVGHASGIPNHSDYAASKAGIIGMVKALAVEFGPDALRVNALLPGGTDTPMNFANAPDAGPEVLDFVNSIHALKRIAKPEEIAKAAVFLASRDSSFVTGSAMLVDGGVSISK